MGSFTNAFENRCLDWCFRNGVSDDVAKPCTLALFTDLPGAEPISLTEVSGGTGYVRQNIDFDAAASGSTANDGAVTFGPASGGAWGTIQSFAIYDSGSNMIAYGTLSEAKTVGDGDSISLAIGALTLTLD